MNCLIELCFVSSIYASAGVGLQIGDYDYDYRTRTNDYGYQIGSGELVIEFENQAYIKLVHFSGLNTTEYDHGLNAIMIGATVYFKGN